MKYEFITKAISFSFVIFFTASCGPEENSRYGDKYWDPQDTWGTAAVVSTPNLNVVYRDVGDDPDVWQAYVSIDFSNIILRYEQPETPSGLLTYTVGSMEKSTVSSFVQNGATDGDSKFFYDVTTSTDYRLRLTEPEIYTFYLDFSVRQPNGTLKVYNYSWKNIVLPGDIERDTFWANRMNAITNTYCVSCHGGNDANASAVFSLNNSNVANLRNSFVGKINNQNAEKLLPGYPFTSTHTGYGVVNGMTASEKADFDEFVNTLISKKAEGENITTNIVFKTFGTPSIMENDPYQ